MSSSPPSKAARNALIVLTGINLFNFIDRYVLAAVIESIKPEFRLSDAQAGRLVTSFVIVYMLTSPFFGALGDRGKRPRLIALGVAIWSLATAAAAFARGFLSLFLARAAVGVGEAAYGTIAPAMLSDHYAKALRGRAFGVFFAAIPIGSALGYVLGGLVDAHLGWRAAFFVAGAPGLFLALLALRLSDPPRGAQEEVAPATEPGGAHPAAGVRGYFALLENRAYVLTVLGYAAYTFALGGLAFWMPPFLARVRGLDLASANAWLGGILVVTGFFGTFAGGWIGDWLLRRTSEAYLWLSGLTTLAAIPFAVLAFLADSKPLYLGGIALAEVLLFASTGPINTAIVNAVRPEMRAMAVAASIFTIHLLGDAISPWIVGQISDALRHRGATEAAALAQAVLIMPIALAIGGAIWTCAAARGSQPERS
jgi:predicted MFS family arabinose efflux permease